jgi:hypothetical protein
MRYRLFLALAAIAAGRSPVGLPGTLLAQQPATTFERRELTIPMRDGVKLFAVALVPVGVTTPLPIMFIRTPYSAARAFRSDTDRKSVV